jgi:hypothetical protein
MARYWSDKDANGRLLTDGRVCLVIAPEDPNLPKQYTYGTNKDEVLEKLALTVETGQATIHKLRHDKPASSAAPAAPAATSAVTADEVARATADLSNPAKAGEGVKTLLRSQGVDVDAIKFREHTNLMARVAKDWEDAHQDPIWEDPRNQQLLMNTAVLKFGFQRKPCAEALDLAYEHLQEQNMIFAVAAPPVQPGGNPDSRTEVVSATSHRRRDLRATAPVVTAARPKYTRAQVDAMNSRELRDKLDNEPGFKELFNQYASTPVKKSA